MHKKILYIHISNNLIYQEHNNSLPLEIQHLENTYYSNIYNNVSGYFSSEDFFEIPLWIAEAHFFLKDFFDFDLLIINNLNDLNCYLSSLQIDFILGSVLDATKTFFLSLISDINPSFKGKFLLGGYINPLFFKDFNNNFIWFNNISDLSSFFKIPYNYGTDYSLFKGLKIIPRLRLSSGCSYHCKFCTIDNKIIPVEYQHIIQMVYSLKPLFFTYVYIDDKTFGQSENFILLEEIFYIIKSFNSSFEGFIIQTTASVICKEFLDFHKLHIKIVEFGLETFNNNILSYYKKPINENMIIQAIKVLINNNISFIPNIIIGLIGENNLTYHRTFSFLNNNLENILFFNFFYLSVYENTELFEDLIDNDIILTTIDSNETILDKSFYTSKQHSLNLTFYKQLLILGNKLVEN